MAKYYSSATATGVESGKVREMLDDCMVDFKVVFQRMQEIEKYEKARLTKRQNNSINRFTLIFTVFFCLPLIQ